MIEGASRRGWLAVVFLGIGLDECGLCQTLGLGFQVHTGRKLVRDRERQIVTEGNRKKSSHCCLT